MDTKWCLRTASICAALVNNAPSSGAPLPDAYVSVETGVFAQAFGETATTTHMQDYLFFQDTQQIQTSLAASVTNSAIFVAYLENGFIESTQYADAIARTDFTFGVLKSSVYANAQRDADRYSFDPVVNGGPVDALNPYGALAQAYATGYWVDRIRLTGMSPGETLEFEVALRLHSYVSAVCSLGDAFALTAFWIFNVSLTLDHQACQSDLDGITGGNQTLVARGSWTAPWDVDYAMGGYLMTYAQAGTGTGVQPAFPSYVDAMNTSLISLRLLTEGAGYVTESGTRYPASLAASSVPEPGSLPLALVALLCMACLHLTEHSRVRNAVHGVWPPGAAELRWKGRCVGKLVV